MLIEVPAWEDYNPRNDYKTLPWLRLQSDIWKSKKLFGLTAGQKWLWIVLLNHVAEENKNGRLEVESSYLAFHSGIPVGDADQAIAHFERKGLIRIDPPGETVPETQIPRTGDVREPIVVRTDADRVTDVTRTGADQVPLHYANANANANEDTKTEKSARKRKAASPPPSEFEQDLAKNWAEHASALSTSAKPDLLAYASAIRRIVAEGLTEAETRGLFEHVSDEGCWWHGKVLSPGLLFKRNREGVQRLDTIRAQMASGGRKRKRAAPKCLRCGDAGLLPAHRGAQVSDLGCPDCDAGGPYRGTTWSPELEAQGWRLDQAPAEKGC